MAGGAYLIAMWAVGVVLICEAAFFVLVIWDDGKPVSQFAERDRIMQRWRQTQ
jgi:hypothetical protein